MVGQQPRTARMAENTEGKNRRMGRAGVLQTVICAYQCTSLWREANKSAKQQQIHKIPQVALFIYLHLPGLPAAKSRWHTLP